jgi:muconolactone delta-isomerase
MMSEYLVTMTTHVPAGTSDAAVEEIRTREAAHSRDLADDGHLLRLWRPPLQPGEWRSIGLFAATDREPLEEILRSMPLRVWRKDEVIALSPHPNDPGRQAGLSGPALAPNGGSEFLTTFTITVPPETPSASVDAADAGETERTRDLARHGQLRRLWKLPEDDQALGLWLAHDADEMQEILASLPLSPWFSVETTQLAPHPSDPALAHD